MTDQVRNNACASVGEKRPLTSVSSTTKKSIDKQGPIRVRPALDSTIEKFLASPDQLHAAVETFGSPLNIVFPELFHKNLNAFQETFDHHALQGGMFFTTKPNKSSAIVREASTAHVGVDVSSLGSLQAALAQGFHPRRIEATGPKNRDYLALALQQGIIINVDSLDELRLVIQMKESLALSQKVPVMIRLCGFRSSHTSYTSQDSTFGTHVDESASIFEMLEQYRDHLTFLGFSFHINTPAVREKLVAIENTLSLTLESIRRGFQPKGINIGGGFRINYAADPDEWQHFIESLKHSVLTHEDAITWNNSGFGYYSENGRLRGAPNFMDHVGLHSPADVLCQLLSEPLPMLDNISAGRLLSESMLSLYIEPGRAMLDQLGITVARVLGGKRSERGEDLVVLEMNRSNLNATELKLLTDPIHIPQQGNEKKRCEGGVYYTGSLCVHNELIQYRKHFPEYHPQAGDLIVFANTAPYMMDFVESETLQQPTASKIAAYPQGESFALVKDELYRPSALRHETAMPQSDKVEGRYN